MAVYKVPQDVEADDKLIGPFTFRQFIYLIVVAVAMAVAWFLGQLFIGLIILPLPIIFFFGALALPLRKDQPMETYLLALVRFYFKPKSRLWDPDGTFSRVKVIASITEDVRLTKDYGSDEADRRLSYLAQVIDTGGWASRGVTSAPATNMIDTYYNEAMHTEDIMDNSASVAQSFDALIGREDVRRKQMVATQFQQAMAQPPSPTTAQTFTSSITDDTAMDILEAAGNNLESNPYPSSMNQTVIQPLDERHQVHTQQMPVEQRSAPIRQATPIQQTQTLATPAIQSSAKPDTATVSSDIMRLANNSSHLTVSALAHEAHRLESKDSEEVVIDLR